jgi:Tfp pilus assembly protein PilF
MDLYVALSALKQGKAEAGMRRLKTIAASDTYQDVKADACYFLGEHLMGVKPAQTAAALDYLKQSLAHYPRQRACLAAAVCHMERKDWPKAKTMLERTLRGFPDGDRRITSDAKRLLRDVVKQMAGG